MRDASGNVPAVEFANVVPLEQQAGEHEVHVDTPDTAPTEDEPRAIPKEKPPTAPPLKTSAADPPAANAANAAPRQR